MQVFSLLFQATFSVFGEKVNICHGKKLVRMSPCQERSMCRLSEFQNFLCQCLSVHLIVRHSVGVKVPLSDSLHNIVLHSARYFLGESLIFTQSWTLCHCWKWCKLQTQCQWTDLVLISRCYSHEYQY